MKYYVTIADRTVEVDLSGPTPVVDGTPMQATLAHVPGTPLRHLLVEGRSVPLVARAEERRGHWTLALAGATVSAEAVDERTRAIREMTGSGAVEARREVVAPMPGLVVKVEVEPGQRVKQGQGVVIVEAMKMENELKAPTEGIVARVLVQPGQTVDKGAVLLVLE